jgi:hypothetical protein
VNPQALLHPCLLVIAGFMMGAAFAAVIFGVIGMRRRRNTPLPSAPPAPSLPSIPPAPPPSGGFLFAPEERTWSSSARTVPRPIKGGPEAARTVAATRADYDEALGDAEQAARDIRRARERGSRPDETTKRGRGDDE